jgi:hypothetical protein
MLTNIALYVANRAAGGSVGSIARWASWGALATIFGVLALVFGAIALYTLLVPLYGAIFAAAAIAGAALALALACLATPALMDMSEQWAAARRARETSPLTATLESANEEAAAATDYFGPLQVVASAFLIGMRTGSQVRSRGRAKA